ncbi:uncharacterized protein LOC100118357 isoform X1 [Nasonia vitripennis]|uniref:Uncharacterized protein n=1 Tax=Nasonia vitripennis TaxID=7425 RepID=A0A7M7LLP2_NASVI|nr:uncharacterized protein LOC100118357 isoform X1 [Nasonia vitripennis]
MGACLGHCLTAIADRFSHRSYRRHTNVSFQGEEQAEFDQTVNQTEEQDSSDPSRSKKLLSFFSLKQFKQNHRVPVTLELIEDTGWPGRSNKYSRLSSKNVSTSSGLDNPLQMLDARGLLLHQGCVSSTRASSVDLEWEHEGMPMPILDNEKLESPDESLSEPSVHNSQPSSLTASPWSRVSTPNSLEWDPVEADMVDVETEKLLTEIERLTDRALKETGDWTTSS